MIKGSPLTGRDPTADPGESTLGERIGAFAAAPRPLDDDASAMASARLLDSLGAMLAAQARTAPARARSIATAHARPCGAGLVGAPSDCRVACQWAAFANGVALRELDLGDMFAGADYARPSDTIPALLATAQQCRRSGLDLLHAIVVAYEVQLTFARAISLHPHGVNPVAHLGPAIAAGLGALLGAPAATTAQAVNATAQLSFMSRQAGRGGNSDWRTFAPATIGRLTVETMDYALRGGTAPEAVFEDPGGPYATFLGADVELSGIVLPRPDEPCRTLLDSFPKAHAAQYQSQVLIDLALRMRAQCPDLDRLVRIEVRTSEHLHRAIGTSWRDDLQGNASRPSRRVDAARLIISVLRNGKVPLEQECKHADPLEACVQTMASDEWSSRSHNADPAIQSFGAEMTLEFETGRVLEMRLERPDAHRLGEHPWSPADYRRRFRSLTSEHIAFAVQDRMIDEIENLLALPETGVAALELGGSSPGCDPIYADTIFG